MLRVCNFGTTVTISDSFELTVSDIFRGSIRWIDDVDVRKKALEKMEEYYKNNEEIQKVVDGENEDCNTCIFAFEGLGSAFGSVTQGIQNTKPYCYHKLPYNFLNAMMVVTKGKQIVYVTRRASTLPDWRPDPESMDRITTLQPGIYNYKTGDHKGKYIALVPDWDNSPKNNWDSWYIENAEFKEGGADGINLHATGNLPGLIVDYAHSWGCQTVYYKDYVEFGKKVGFLMSTVQDVTESTTRDRGVSTLVAEKTLTTSSSNDLDVSVKYVLDRFYDEKNRDAGYSNGIFYPKNSVTTQ